MWEMVGSLSGPVLGALRQVLKPIRRKPLPVQAPLQANPRTPTPVAEVEQTLQQLSSKKAHWVDIEAAERAKLLHQVLEATIQVADEAAATGASYKGSYGSGNGEELMVFLVAVTIIKDLIDAMLANGQPKPNSLHQREDGQWVANVWPSGILGLMFPGCRGEVWIQLGKEPSQGALYAAKAANRPLHNGKLSLVLGAGNQIAVVVGDILHKLFMEDAVVVCKMNPINDYYGPHLERAFKALTDIGVLSFVYGGAEIGKMLTDHQLVEDVHITGSTKTFNAIVWGDPDGPKLDAAGRPPAPRLSKQVTGELGNVTPYIVVPGPWSAADIEYYAGEIVSGLQHNCGHNCIAAQVIITSSDWPQRPAFMAALRSRLAASPRRCPWYPGSAAKFADFRRRFPQAEELGYMPEGVEAPEGTDIFEPTLLAADLTPDQVDASAENWIPALQEVSLPSTGGDVESFLQQAVAFANDRCWGTLAAAVLMHPTTKLQYKAALDRALSDLRYGCIVVNSSVAMGFSCTEVPWGAFPGNPLHDVGSGNCFVHNTLMFDHAQKGVVRMSWGYPVTPCWGTSHYTLHEFGPWAMRVQANRDNPLRGLPALVPAIYYSLLT